MRINSAKCILKRSKIQFLGYKVLVGTRPPPKKIEAIRNFPNLETTKQLRQFLGTVNFYCRFIPGAARGQAELNEMFKGPKTRKKKLIAWTEEQEQTFVNCKKFATS